MAMSRLFNPAFLGLAFGTGEGIGQLTNYVVGYTGREVVSKKYKRSLNDLLKFLNRYGIVVVFFFAAIPVLYGLLLISAGLAHYSLRKVFLAGLGGKISMSLIITYASSAVGRILVKKWIFGAAITISLLSAIVIVFIIAWRKFMH
jgi:membrane protein DedA with SNARE-associated domain